jgi:hypothetical protein
VELPGELGSELKSYFLHLTDIILDAFLIHKYSGGKMTHKVFGSLVFGF